MTLTPEHVKLKELAGKATPGPWEVRDDDFHTPLWRVGSVNSQDRIGLIDYTKYHGANAAYIAAANPSTILSLLKDLEEARAALEEKSAELRGANKSFAQLLARAETAERERDEANARAAVLGEAISTFVAIMDSDDCRAYYKLHLSQGYTDLKEALTSLPASAKALLRTPGTVEVCGKCGYGRTYRFSTEMPAVEIWDTCTDEDCPIRPQQGKANT